MSAESYFSLWNNSQLTWGKGLVESLLQAVIDLKRHSYKDAMWLGTTYAHTSYLSSHAREEWKCYHWATPTSKERRPQSQTWTIQQRALNASPRRVNPEAEGLKKFRHHQLHHGVHPSWPGPGRQTKIVLVWSPSTTALCWHQFSSESILVCDLFSLWI